MSHIPGSDYHVKPEQLTEIIDTFVSPLDQTFADRSRRVTGLITENLRVYGVEHIPADGPIVVVKNHPCHYDALLLSDLFEARPDVRLLAKPSPLMRRMPSENTLLLSKNGPHGDPNDITTLQNHLRDGGSLLATPWGSLDHQAKQNVTKERAIRNVARFASFAGATVLPVQIETDWHDDNHFPLRNAAVTFMPPVPNPNAQSINPATEQAVSDMYDRFAR